MESLWYSLHLPDELEHIDCAIVFWLVVLINVSIVVGAVVLIGWLVV